VDPLLTSPQGGRSEPHPALRATLPIFFENGEGEPAAAPSLRSPVPALSRPGQDGAAPWPCPPGQAGAGRTGAAPSGDASRSYTVRPSI